MAQGYVTKGTVHTCFPLPLAACETINMSAVRVKVAVRTRPMNRRENDLKSSCVVQVKGNQIFLMPPLSYKEDHVKVKKEFTFDHCFWSVDEKHAGQEEVFGALGSELIDNVFKGFNACIFAYGQTGSGKSFSMMGTDEQPGLIPMISSELFKRENNDSRQLRVEVSFMEIYNEKVRDLLQSKEKQKLLKVRESKQFGPYVEGLSHHTVTSYESINCLVLKANKHRTTAATNMNDESSRSHAIFSITVSQIHINHSAGSTRELTGKISLVDLAGSERVSKTGAEGEHLKESKNINKSLTALGRVIFTLSNMSEGKTSYVNYRDSVLTWLLKNNLGGNSKTVMLATISPAADNYHETLSTLTYADSAKRIVNQAVVNEDTTCKAIGELQEEVRILKEKLNQAENMHRDLQELQCKLREKEDLLEELNINWEEKLQNFEATQERQKHLDSMGITVEQLGIRIDPTKSYLFPVSHHADHKYLFYYLKESTTVGAGPSQDIHLTGPGIEIDHGVINVLEGFVTSKENALTYVNGQLVQKSTDLWDGDKVTLGSYTFMIHLPHRKRTESVNNYMEGHLGTDSLSFTQLHGNDLLHDSLIDYPSSPDFKQIYTHPMTDKISNILERSVKLEAQDHIYSSVCKSSVMDKNINSGLQNQAIDSESIASFQEPLRMQSNDTISDQQEFPHCSLLREQISEDTGLSLKLFYWDKTFDVSWLAEQLKNSLLMPITGVSFIPLSVTSEDEWKAAADRNSVIVMCHSPRSGKPRDYLNPYMEYFMKTWGPSKITMIIIDLDNDPLTGVEWRNWWYKSPFAQCNLQLFTTEEMDEKRRPEHKSKDLKERQRPQMNMSRVSCQEATQLKLPSQRGLVVGICSKEPKNHQWLEDLLKTERFKQNIKYIQSIQISSDISQFQKDISNCTFCILYHSGKQGAPKTTNGLFDDELETMSHIFEKRRIIAVTGDLEDSSGRVKRRMQHTQTNIMNFTCRLTLFNSRQIDSIIKGHIISRSVKRKLDKLQKSLTEASNGIYISLPSSAKLDTLAICSRDSRENYQWIEQFLRNKNPCRHVSSIYISNDFGQFCKEISRYSCVILYHTKNRGRIKITNVCDSLYDKELEFMNSVLGKNKIIVVVDDLDDSSDEEKDRILRNQPNIGDWACGLFLFNTKEKSSRLYGSHNKDVIVKLERLCELLQ
ncbi:kinesin-like protein KIF16B isoform X2 [Xenopus laevis]|uniref:Kinesin-like protein KIF16B isoform X2 n=1 Tax=Xenopus laevis TaxID=8355 RepID=A0A8J1LUF9_XENLA|nr:kinesin-like protein KIF16B isoform X2 [Xenopus laevis]